MSPTSRRDFLQTLAASSACAAITPALRYAREEELSARLAFDPLRPQCHLLPARNWMNDPNAPIYWEGRYHMFFQYNPNAAVWGDMHWAHAVSEDMIHWRHLPAALAPMPGGPDGDGCFTGSGVIDHGEAFVLYTGVTSVAPERATLRDGLHNFREVQCLASSSDSLLRTWKKRKEPVLQPPQDPQLTGFRDPFLWREGPFWYLGVGSGQLNRGGRVLLYRGANLYDWEYLHPLASGNWRGKESINPVDSGEMWECPDFFPLGKKHVLLYATAGQVIWETGDLDTSEMKFHPEKRGLLDQGAYYAQKTQLDAQGNRILWGWIPETRAEAEYSAAGWAGCMALPRILTISANGELEMQFAPQTRSLRGKNFVIPDKPASGAERARSLAEVKIEGLAGEVIGETSASPFHLSFEDRAGVWYSLTIDVQRDSLKIVINGQTTEIAESGTPKLELHLFLDGSVAELICNRRHSFTSRIYRKPDGPLCIRLSEGDFEKTSLLSAWQLRPISRDRLTS